MVSIMKKPTVTAPWLHGSVVVSNAVEIDGREFTPLEKSQWAIVKLLGIKNARVKCSVCKDLVVLRNTEIERLCRIGGNDGTEDLDVDDKKLTARAKRVKTLFDVSGLPQVITIEAPAVSEAPRTPIKVLTTSSPQSLAWVELCEEVIEYLHEASQHQLRSTGEADDDDPASGDEGDGGVGMTSPLKHVFFSQHHKSWIVRYKTEDDERHTKKFKCNPDDDKLVVRSSAELFKKQTQLKF